MTFLARIVRLLFWLLVISWSVRLLRHFFSWVFGDTQAVSKQTTDSPAMESATAPRRLVRDPVCGMHLDETLSIPFREGGELVHFCSTACRDAYAGNAKKLAANG